MLIRDLKNINDINNMDEITVNGETIDVDELTQRIITVYGVQPTDYEEWTFIDVIVQLRNKKDGAGGTAQATYRYADLSDIHKFHEHQYPYKLPVLMADGADKKGNVVQQIVYADFAAAQEMQLIPRQAQTAPKPQPKP